MRRITAIAAIFSVALTSACGIVLGLDGVRACDGAECSDAAAPDAPPLIDASNDQDAALPDAWTPAAFGSDLALWLTTDYGVTATNGLVASWQDRAHGAVAVSDAAPPTLDKGVAAAHDAVHFTLANGALHLPDSTWLRIAVTDEFLIETVARVNALDDSSLHFFSKADTTGATFGQGFRFFAGFPNAAGQLSANMSDGTASSYDIPSGAIPFKDGAFHAVGLRRALSGSSSDTRFNIDTLEPPSAASNPVLDISAAGIPASIGQVHPDAVPGSACDFSVAEILIVRRSGQLTPIDLAHVWNYFKAKYGF